MPSFWSEPLREPEGWEDRGMAGEMIKNLGPSQVDHQAGLTAALLNGRPSRSCFLPGPDFSISCSTSKSGAQPHCVTSVPWARFLLVLPPASIPHLAHVQSTKVFMQSWVPGMRCLDSAALIQNQNQGLPAIEKSLLNSKTRLLLKLLPLAWKQCVGGTGGVGSRLGGEATSRRQRGRRGQGWSCA